MDTINKPVLKILCIDGGGIRGIIPCIILQEIEKRMNKPLSEVFDLIAGTSTGGIISVGLTIPDANGKPKLDAGGLLELYTKYGGEIFKKRRFKTVSQLFYPGYSADGLERLLKERYGDTQLKDALTEILITSVDTQTNKPFYFLSRLAKDINYQKTENFLMREVARSTSAAPTFFPANEVKWGKKTLSLVDGGLYANNPSTLAFSEANELWTEIKNQPKKVKSGIAGINDRDLETVVTATIDAAPFFMLSLGTGQSDKPIPYTSAEKWGMLPWIWKGRIIDLVMHSVSESTHYQMQYVLPDYPNGTKRYVRLNTSLTKGHEGMDDTSPSNLNALMDMGHQVVKDNDGLIDIACERLRQ